MPLTWRHWWIVAVASLGQLVGTAVATIAGVIIPLINITRHPELSSWMQGLIGAADLAGIMIGSVIFGRLSDRYGYLFFLARSTADQCCRRRALQFSHYIDSLPLFHRHRHRRRI